MEKNEHAEQDLTQNGTDQILEETQPTEENVTENEKEPISDSQENKLETEVAELKQVQETLKKQFSEEQIIAVLKEHQAGIAVADLCRKHGISDATFYK